MGSLDGLGAKASMCQGGGVSCSGNVVARCYGSNRADLCMAHKARLCVRWVIGGGGGGGRGEYPNGVCIEQYAPCLLLNGTTTGHFLLMGWGRGRGDWFPSFQRGGGGGGWHSTPTNAPRPRCPVGRHCPGQPARARGHLGAGGHDLGGQGGCMGEWLGSPLSSKGCQRWWSGAECRSMPP